MNQIFIVLFSLTLISSCVQTAEKVKSHQVDSTMIQKSTLIEQNVDSMSASKIVVDFYTWYAEAIRSSKQNEIQPKFVKDSNGMATLDMSNYISSLRKKKFSENLIAKTTNNFKTCLSNLKDIHYDSLESQFELSDYEEISCDFFNYYQWTMDMEPHDGADVISFTKSNNAIVIKMMFYNINDNKKSYWEYKYAQVSLIKETDQWLINNIEIIFNR